MKMFETMHLLSEPTAIATDRSDLRALLEVEHGSMAHFQFDDNQISKAITHNTVEEIWYILSGRGQMWRMQDS